ncbi:MAG: hypothetical protein R3C58_07005 [Parvularculaceae bacterium]
MKIRLIAAAMLVAVAPAFAKDKKAKDEAPPPPPTTYEMEDAQMGEALDRICLAAPLSAETYDSKDNMLVVATNDGGHAFIHFVEGCDLNTMMFASEASGGENGCYKPGDAMTLTASFGAKSCKIKTINKWLDDPEFGDEGAGEQY